MRALWRAVKTTCLFKQDLVSVLCNSAKSNYSYEKKQLSTSSVSELTWSWPWFTLHLWCTGIQTDDIISGPLPPHVPSTIILKSLVTELLHVCRGVPCLLCNPSTCHSLRCFGIPSLLICLNWPKQHSSAFQYALLLGLSQSPFDFIMVYLSSPRQSKDKCHVYAGKWRSAYCQQPRRKTNVTINT